MVSIRTISEDYYQIGCDIKITKRNEPVPERVVTKLRKIEVLVGHGDTLLTLFDMSILRNKPQLYLEFSNWELIEAEHLL